MKNKTNVRKSQHEFGKVSGSLRVIGQCSQLQSFDFQGADQCEGEYNFRSKANITVTLDLALSKCQSPILFNSMRVQKRHRSKLRFEDALQAKAKSALFNEMLFDGFLLHHPLKNRREIIKQ